MTTAAAIDLLVHHSVILELNIPSYRMEQAKKKKAERGVITESQKGKHDLFELEAPPPDLPGFTAILPSQAGTSKSKPGGSGG